MILTLVDRASGRRGRLAPRGARPVTIYVCGPTVYDAAHVGHARTYLQFDLVRRHLELEGIPVRHVMNITDFEEKLSIRAHERRVGWRTLARAEEARFLEDLDALGLRLPTDMPRASEQIDRIRSVARRLVRTGRTRQEGSLVTYAPPRRRALPGFAGPSLLGSVVEEGPETAPAPEKAMREFAVWQPSYAHGPSWPSPWGRGLPGWHLECYAMASHLLGLPVDLHGGGLDLAFPHHAAEAEIARALDRRPFARHYLHVGLVRQGGAKMSKSTGNLVTLRSALARSTCDSFRWYLLGRHYLDPLDYDERALARAGEALASVRAAVRRQFVDRPTTAEALRSVRALAGSVERAVADDLHADLALSALSRWARGSAGGPRSAGRRGSEATALELVGRIERRLGIVLGPDGHERP